MGRQRGSASVAPILLVLGLLGIAVAAVTLWPLVTAAGEDRTAMRAATATVVESRPCGADSARDLVEVRVDGVTRQAPFDGCGHARGQQLPVLVPADPVQDFVVRPAGSDSDLKAQTQRANWVLLTLAAVAGGGYGLMLRRR
ncbi:hypothetical protein FDZ84_17105 [Saccharopolyspora sp. ASAGF58]|nr:hypothetical protein FDZ84_17105 [Saccharopolyspora sp. ASAGF58]